MTPAGAACPGLEARFEKVLFSPDGRWLAAGDAKGILQLWDLQAPDVPIRMEPVFPRRSLPAPP